MPGSSHKRRDLHRTITKSLNHTHLYLLVIINGIDVAGLKASSGEELCCSLALEQQMLFGHLHQDETHYFSHVHAADHLLKPVHKQEKTLTK